MVKKLRVFLFSDALGWEIVTRYHFMEAELPYRMPVRTQFGYSSTAVPTILSGEPPTRHGHFSFFFFDKEGKSPFRFFRHIHWLLHPSKIFDNHRIRHRLSSFLKKHFKFTGYFSLYRVPYSRLPYFDYCEKSDIFAPHGLGEAVPNLRDMLESSGISYHISDWRRPDDENLAEATRLISVGRTSFLFIYTAGIDGMLHFHVGEPEYVANRLGEFAERVNVLISAARSACPDDWSVTVFSDHGMTPLAGSADIRSRIEKLNLKFGRDYAVAYDSTMMRVWFLKPEYREKIMAAAGDAPGHWLSEDEKKELQIDFPDRRYGDGIFLLDPGIQLVPSDMGAKPIPGMHGYSPADRDSEASLLSTRPFPYRPSGIAGFFTLMKLAAAEIGEADE